MTLRFVKTNEKAIMPTYGTGGSVGMDITLINVKDSYKESVANYGHRIGETVLYGTGLRAIIPSGNYLRLVPRSNISKGPFRLANSEGIIDNDYTGEIFVPVDRTNFNEQNKCGATILDSPFKNAFQLIITPYFQTEIIEGKEEDIPTTERGSGGFGSTNK